MSQKLFEEEVAITDIGGSRFLIQFTDSSNIDFSIPKVGEYILSSQKKRINNVVACESELIIYLKDNQIDSLLKSLNRKELEIEQAKSSTYKLGINFSEGIDWDEIVDQVGLRKSTIIKKLCAKEFEFQMFGFLPGFMYLDGLDKKLYTKRRHKPRNFVEAGSVGLGGKYIGIYGMPSPAGWHIIGTVKKRPLNRLMKHIKIGDKLNFTIND